MTKYRKKPIEVEAFQFGYEPIPKWFKDVCKLFGYTTYSDEQYIDTLLIHYPKNSVKIYRGEYVIKGIEGEVYSCKPDIFKKTYDVVEGNKYWDMLQDRL
ncbi:MULTISPECIES: hypothetical protein [Bacillus amyloliquefaciens group]|uniref:hypothetical protein n=1 Tax=Bacillus amyloliquefaciens group TaxID=1938374 RepID=UPI00214F7C8B|nr:MULTISPECIES: hypothetical protein [Bacillus amyloliquefaciens group]MCR4367800.1 hypothetical protein [Bacillus amyloliquefaciens]MCV3202482.1 hypothetical protein [Bacillus velezensis]